MTFELHRLGDTVGATAPDLLSVALTVDGNVLYDGDVTATRELSSTGASHKLTFGFRNIPLASEEGDGVAVHDVHIVVGSYNETQSAWVFDTTEVPAGVTFKPAKLAPGALD